jgi:CRP/FNR family cyclic AMP-dependent transcriptional regulator
MENESLPVENILNSVLAMRGLEKRELGLLGRYGVSVSFRAGKTLYCQGDRAESAFLILEGSIVPVKYGGDAESFELPPRKPASWAGLAETLSDAVYGFDASAPGGCEALRYSRFNLEQILSDVGMARYLLGELAKENCRLMRALENDRPLSRIVEYLLLRRRTTAGLASSVISITQTQIAQAIGTTRETVNKHMKAMERSGLLKTGRGAIEILDWDALMNCRQF